MNDKLIEMIKTLLGDTVALKFKAHGYHWNVEGDDFPQAHTFFGMLYEDYEDAIDSFAEMLRRLDTYAPFKLSRFLSLSVDVPETDVTSDFSVMAADLLASNDATLERLKDAFDEANTARQQGVANFLAERIDMHQKWHWQLKAIIKPEPSMD